MRCSTKSRMSCLVTRPPVPVPLTLARSTLCSRASLRTSGEERTSESSSSCSPRGALAGGAAGGAGASVFTRAGAAHFCEIHTVLAGEFADERGRADVGIFFVLGSTGGRHGRSLGFCLYRCRSGRSRSGRSGLGESGSGSATAVANHTDDGVDLNGVAFGNLDFLKNSAGGRGDFGVDLVGGNLEQGLVTLDLVAGLFQPLGDGSFEN